MYSHVSAEQQSPEEINRIARNALFAEELPPFVASEVFAAPDGRVWVRRSLPRDSLPTFDVFDRSGGRVAWVSLPLGRRLLAFGSRAVYASVADEDGLLSLERYRLP